MIKNNDFRIGNFTYGIEKKPEAIRKVTSINNDNIYLVRVDGLYGHLGYTYDNINPIPLTEYWLIKFGFKEFMSPTYLRISIGLGVMLQFCFEVDKIECYIGDEIYKTDVNYVHQLQNLYFALTGVELQLSSNVA